MNMQLGNAGFERSSCPPGCPDDEHRIDGRRCGDDRSSPVCCQTTALGRQVFFASDDWHDIDCLVLRGHLNHGHLLLDLVRDIADLIEQDVQDCALDSWLDTAWDDPTRPFATEAAIARRRYDIAECLHGEGLVAAKDCHWQQVCSIHSTWAANFVPSPVDHDADPF